jgi:DNA transformation protein and related proteins
MGLTDLPNVGRVLAGNLEAVGVCTPEQLRLLGAKEAFTRIRATVDSGACLHMLYGLQGAIEGVPDSQLSDATKDDLRCFFRDLQV